MRTRKALIAALAAVGLVTDAEAVSLDPDGIGQALIYPYYTIQNTDGSNSWNTYLSVANLTPDAKAVRVRFREGRAGRDIGNFNLFLAPNDVWSGAIVPSTADSSSVARIITADNSCTDPRLSAAGEPFTNALYSGSHNDGEGAGLDRTREGYVEIIEMASLTMDAALAVTHVNGIPDDCLWIIEGSSYSTITPAMIKPPSGGLTGTLTLINVNSGMDMGMNAVALADLAQFPFLRKPADSYPGLDAPVQPVSTVRAGSREYDLKWRSGAEAVSSVFMASELLNEYVLDPGTASQTDWVVTFPTRPYMSLAAPPFVEDFVGVRDVYDREGNTRRDDLNGVCVPGVPCPAFFLDHVAAVAFPVGHQNPGSLLGSLNGTNLGSIPDEFAAGWMRIRVGDAPGDFGRMRSEPGSTMTDLATGAVTTGRFELFGLPWTGFMVRTFRNGTLRCSVWPSPGDTSCQGNYGGSFPHRYVRTITQLP